MSIKAKYNQPAKMIDIDVESTIINWRAQNLDFQLSNGQNYNHKLTKKQWDYLVKGLQSLMNNIPNISDIEIPEFNEDITQ